ncbi:MAG: transporter substrate-binding domain-containing protein [Spirochaetes bacterium]|nr:transporter substrate-binding domain-containing protein [Spirochaetota bacterium]
MKKLISIILFLFCYFTYSQSKILLATGEWPPYTSESMSGYGAFTEVVTAVLNEMNVNFEYKWFPWKRAEEEVRKGNFFACFPYMKNEERAKNYYFSAPLLSTKGKFFYLKGNIPKDFQWKTLNDFNDYIMGGVRGYWYLSDFQKAGLRVDTASTDESNISKLYYKRFHFALTDELVGWQIIKKNYPNDITRFDTLNKPYNQNSLYLMISPNYPKAKQLIEDFNKALVSIKKKGIYEKILKMYNLKNN